MGIEKNRSEKETNYQHAVKQQNKSKTQQNK
jgi:hypothetical protein